MSSTATAPSAAAEVAGNINLVSRVAQNFPHHSARFAVGNPFLLAVVIVNEFGRIKAEEVKQRGMIIIGANRIHHRFVAELVGLPVGHAALDPAPCQPTAEPLSIVIPAGLFGRAMVLG